MLTGDPNKPLADHVSQINCDAVRKFKQEKIERNKDDDNADGDGGGGGGDGGGDPGGGSNPGRGTDPMSRCSDDPDNCIETEPPRMCSYEWDGSTATYTVTCSY